MRQCVPDNRHLSAGTRPITTRHCYFTKGTRIIITITLTPDKHALVKAGISTRNLVQQGPKHSTPRHISHRGGFSLPEKALSHRAAHYNVTGRDGTYQGALPLCLSATVRRTVQAVG
jgi:hypothetical protein